MSHETWVVNASPLIVLAKVGQLALLERPGHELLIPEAVRDEVRVLRDALPRTVGETWEP
jgi:predicted nucleic acid-binding protein